jgi:hypothetical protein
VTKKAEKDAKKDKPAGSRVKDLDSPKEHAKGVRGGTKVKDSHDR